MDEQGLLFTPSPKRSRAALVRAALFSGFFLLWLSSPIMSPEDISSSVALFISIGCILAAGVIVSSVKRWRACRATYAMSETALIKMGPDGTWQVPWSAVMTVRWRISSEDMRLLLVDHDDEPLTEIQLAIFEDGGVAFLRSLELHLSRVFQHELAGYENGSKQWQLPTGAEVIRFEGNQVTIFPPRGVVRRIPLHRIRYVEWQPQNRSGALGGRLIIADGDNLLELPQTIAGLPFLLFAFRKHGLTTLVNPESDSSNELAAARGRRVALGIRAIWLMGIAAMLCLSLVSLATTTYHAANIEKTGTKVTAEVTGRTAPDRLRLRWTEAEAQQERVVTVTPDVFQALTLGTTTELSVLPEASGMFWIKGMPPLVDKVDYTILATVSLIVLILVFCGIRALAQRRRLLPRITDLYGRFLDGLPANSVAPPLPQDSAAAAKLKHCACCDAEIQDADYYLADQQPWCESCQASSRGNSSGRSLVRSILLALAAGGAVLVFWSVAIVYAGKPFPVFAALLGVAVGWGIRSGDLTAKRRPRLLAAAICYFLMSCSLLPNLWIGDDIPTHTEILRQYNEVIVPKSEGQMHEAASYEALKDQIVVGLMDGELSLYIGFATSSLVTPLFYPFWLLQAPLAMLCSFIGLWQACRMSEAMPTVAFSGPFRD